MLHVPRFITGHFKPHHLFLEDGEYARALDALVKAVSDVLITSADGSRVFLGKRKVHPQPDWWGFGGRAKPGESPQEAAARVMRRELCIPFPAARFEAGQAIMRLGWYPLECLDRIAMLRMPMLAPISPVLTAPAGSVDESRPERPRPPMPSMPSATEIFGHWCFNLRPREFSVRLDVKMKRAAAPYPRNPNRKKPVPKVIGSYSMTWAMREQAPSDHGTGDISTFHHLVLQAEEEVAVKIDEKEFSEARWFDRDEILLGQFHPVLKQALRDLQAKTMYKVLQQAVQREAKDADVAQLARSFVSAAQESMTLAEKGVMQVHFDEESRQYAVSFKEEGVAGYIRRSGRMEGKVEDLLDTFRCEISDTDSGSEGPAELEEGAADSRIVTSVQRSCGLCGLAAGPMGQGLVTSRMPGFGKGVPPSTRIQHCVAVAFSEAEVRYEGSRFFVLTTAQDGFNLTWLPSLQDSEKSSRDDPSWLQVALLPFSSVFTKHEGLAAKGPSQKKATSTASAELADPMQVADVLGEELRQHGWEGVHALIFLLAKLYATPQNAFLAMDPENGQVSAVGLEQFFRRQIRQDVEASTGLKPAQLFKALDVRGNGYLSMEDLVCSVTPQPQCNCAVGSQCISEVWKQVAEQLATESFARNNSPGTGSSHSLAQERKKTTTLNLKWTKQANRRKELNSTDARSDEGSRTTRGEIARRNEVMRKERESFEVQDAHLDLEREHFITTVQRTTVLHPLDYQVSRRAMEEMESKRRLVQRLAAEAEAAFARKKGTGVNEDLDGLDGADGQPLLEMTKGRKRNSVSGSKRNSVTGSVSLNLEPEVEEHIVFTSVTKSVQAKKLALASAQAQEPYELRRMRLEVASLVVDPKRPRVAAGIGDGQLAVYYLFRSHGSKRKQLHQIQGSNLGCFSVLAGSFSVYLGGFDASRGVGDVCTALCLPTQRLSDEGSMAVESVLGGFESGRVAVFRSFFPDEIVSETGDKKNKKTLEEVMEERQRIKSLANGEPILQASEPLLLEHFHCSTPIVAPWLDIMTSSGAVEYKPLQFMRHVEGTLQWQMLIYPLSWSNWQYLDNVGSISGKSYRRPSMV
eukprot:symbB.v1.2.036066.t1/scaffold4838.1/size34075/3